MRLLLPTLLFTLFLFLTACGNKSEKQMEQTDISLIKDSLSSGQAPADTTLAAIVPIIEKELNAWIKSFNGFSAESFKYTQTTKIEETACTQGIGSVLLSSAHLPGLKKQPGYQQQSLY